MVLSITAPCFISSGMGVKILKCSFAGVITTRFSGLEKKPKTSSSGLLMNCFVFSLNTFMTIIYLVILAEPRYTSYPVIPSDLRFVRLIYSRNKVFARTINHLIDKMMNSSMVKTGS